MITCKNCGTPEPIEGCCKKHEPVEQKIEIAIEAAHLELTAARSEVCHRQHIMEVLKKLR